MFLYLLFTFCSADSIFIKEYRQVNRQIIIEAQAIIKQQISFDEKLVISITNYPQQNAPLLLICRANTTFTQLPNLDTIQRQNCIADLNSYDFKREKQQIVIDYQEKYKTYMNIIFQEKNRQPFIVVYSEQKIDFKINIGIQKKSSCLWECKQSSTCIQGQCICQEGYFGDDCSINILQFLSNDNYKQEVIYYINAAELEVIYMNFTDKHNYLLDCQAFNPYIYRGKFFFDSFMELSRQQQIDCFQETQKINKEFSIKLQPLFYFIPTNKTIYRGSQDEEPEKTTIIYIITSIVIPITLILIYCYCKCRKSQRRMNNLNSEQIPTCQKVQQEKLINKYLPIQLYDQVIKKFPGLLDDKVCQICLEEYKNDDQVRVTYCTHFFHVECVDLWIEKNETCPTCRSSFNYETMTKIINTELLDGQYQSSNSTKQIISEQSQKNIRLYGQKKSSCSPIIHQHIIL
ncbi:unnamed protein product [Paramecium sonneborni]|uniref:RING-type domain-containing protein n=1 Tax=Paramecium sonneborni TaxID=65129 RepID=A0A8S1KXI7_9CILI|nr:unnamed protein product [Paramecium sonneborni]